MANVMFFEQQQGSNGPRVLRKIVPTANQTLGFDSTGKLVAKSGGTTSVITANGAITVKEGTIFLNKAGVLAATLAAPTATTDDGKVLTIVALTGNAHTVTQTTPGFNNGSTASDVATFGGAVGDSFTVRAYQGIWYVTTKVNVTLG